MLEKKSPMKLACTRKAGTGGRGFMADWTQQTATAERKRRGGWKKRQLIVNGDVTIMDAKVTAIRTGQDGKVYGKYNELRVQRMGYMSVKWRVIK